MLNKNEVIDLTRSFQPTVNYSRAAHIVEDLYVKHIGVYAYAVYRFYCRMVNKDTGRAYPKIEQTAETLGIAIRTVKKCNKILEEFKLVEITSGIGKLHNEYLILKPSEDKLIQHLMDKSLKDLIAKS